MKLKNTILISTDDDSLEKALNEFIAKHCEENEVNAAVYSLSYEFGEEVKSSLFK